MVGPVVVSLPCIETSFTYHVDPDIPIVRKDIISIRIS
jgi:hypothetical protein